MPTEYVQKGAKVDIRGDSRLVRIFHRGELIKTHERQPPGGKSIDHSDYPEHKHRAAKTRDASATRPRAATR